MGERGLGRTPAKGAVKEKQLSSCAFCAAAPCAGPFRFQERPHQSSFGSGAFPSEVFPLFAAGEIEGPQTAEALQTESVSSLF